MGIRIGISGWQFAPWRGSFYPKSVTRAKELEYAARQLDVIEINGTFYRLQQPQSFTRWAEQTPEDFVFTIKAPRYITHIRKLRDVAGPVANFFASGVLSLGAKLGPIVWQFPPTFSFDETLMKSFMQLLPHTTGEANRLAAQHEPFMQGRVALAAGSDAVVRHAIEIRHSSFVDERFYALLAEHNVALIVAENAHGWPCVERSSADFMYLRLHGTKEMQGAGYDAPALERWAEKIRAWGSIGDVFCFFDGPDVKPRAPQDARQLRAIL